MARIVFSVLPLNIRRLGLTVLLALAGLVGLVGFGFGAELPMADVTVEVVDEEGKPVADASVHVDFQQRRDKKKHTGTTDAQGRWRVQERASSIESFCGVKKEGFYDSHVSLDLTRNVPKGVQVTRRWPAMTCRVVLRPIGEPAEAIFRGVRPRVRGFAYPVVSKGEEVGYDFIVGDWVQPHGKGEQADMLVSILVEPAFSYRLRFPRPGDGLIRIPNDAFHYQSDFKWPRLAPLDGYIADWRLDTVNGAAVPLPASLAGPLFVRIRSEVNETGQVTKAYYGRIGKPTTKPEWTGDGLIIEHSQRRFPRGALVFSTGYGINLDGSRRNEVRILSPSSEEAKVAP